MGEKKKLRVVLDTNVLVSALLFKGKLSKIVDLWERGRIIPLISRETFDEFKKVIAYPKFSLTASEIRTIIEENILPFFEVVEANEVIKDACKDRDDDKFLSCAVSARAAYLVTGDTDLLVMKNFKGVKIITPRDFEAMF
ncbi:MAG: putative toxin-antitoxin system toxin component, PIN family [Nitrospirae bacterium]|nr:putative toxin-antitoxin system toxin component, PIN family [Nitrospirota bacterium]PIV40746.1 MAG: putative toxin-antitoxin system toxin component, PIN family [Nitrospirae bacterium CG02_land_8_20_14_3_00_44_33]PIV65740.1 MAG: putative toxin-antitoxin system toxin component, PIN family [Nitrospirae bacterium CG01_land_8_20_14_3_00_44_22]PIW88996.1 MAG: putative toxin-antitoxin system toxin component, PIN family [Nitrospirae bacterium CG_4_8_14_3_um_filter_44_28]PJA82000.1 MAG: putative toxi